LNGENILGENTTESKTHDLEIKSPNQSIETFGDKKHTINSCLSPLLSINFPSKKIDFDRLVKLNKNEVKTPVRQEGNGSSKHFKIIFRLR
jgi:hypothetical protein